MWITVEVRRLKDHDGHRKRDADDQQIPAALVSRL
jgi:hypothetical protein